MKKKIITAVTILVLTLSLMVPALAEGTDGGTGAGSPGLGVILWLISGGTTLLLLIALFIARKIRDRRDK